MENINKECNYTVYMHINKFNDKKYIGITSNDVNKRWGKDGNGYKEQLFYRAIQKYGWNNFEHKIVAECLKAEDAYEMEQTLISKYKTKEKEFGYNNSDGGESGSKGAINVQFNRMLPVYQYDLDGKYIQKFICIEDVKRKLNIKGKNITSCCKGRRKTAYGFQWFHEYKGLKISPVEDGKLRTVQSKSKNVYQYSIDGFYVQSFSSVSEAERETCIKGISSCAKQKVQTAGNYRWFYTYQGSKIDSIMSKSKRSSSSCSKPVFQYSLDGNYICKYNSVNEAARAINISHTVISSVCNKETGSAGGFQWRFYKTEKIRTYCKNNSSQKTIYVYDCNNNIVDVFNSIKHAVDVLKISRYHILNSINKNELIKGYAFSYSPLKEDKTE